MRGAKNSFIDQESDLVIQPAPRFIDSESDLAVDLGGAAGRTAVEKLDRSFIVTGTDF